MADVEITGLKELYDRMQELPAKVEANIMRGALRAGAKVIMIEAKLLCPQAPPSGVAGKKYGAKMGELARSIRISTRTKAGIVTARVVAGNFKAFYAHMVEFGTRAHVILPKTAKSLNVKGAPKAKVSHPGASAQPFMRPAFDHKWREAVDVMSAYIRERLPDEFVKRGITFDALDGDILDVESSSAASDVSVAAP